MSQIILLPEYDLTVVHGKVCGKKTEGSFVHNLI